jgi:predicted ATPase
MTIDKREHVAVLDLSCVSSVTLGEQEESFEEEDKQILYGRTREVNQLHQAFDRLCSTGKAQLVMIHGEAGSGKTGLAETLRSNVLKKGGYFVTGCSWFSRQHHEQDSAIAAALSDLCEVMVQSSDFNERRAGIQDSLDSREGKLLFRAITSCAPFLRDDSNYSDSIVSLEEEVLPFQAACKTFLHALSSGDHPIVMFLDDVHWMDRGSMELLRLLLQDGDLRHVLIILTFRTEESKRLSLLLQNTFVRLESVDIVLPDLTVDHVYELLLDIMDCSPTPQIRRFSEVMAAKTHGNPRNIAKFIERLARSGLLRFDKRTMSWVYDVERIQKEEQAFAMSALHRKRKINCFAGLAA